MAKKESQHERTPVEEKGLACGYAAFCPSIQSHQREDGGEVRSKCKYVVVRPRDRNTTYKIGGSHGREKQFRTPRLSRAVECRTNTRRQTRTRFWALTAYSPPCVPSKIRLLTRTPWKAESSLRESSNNGVSRATGHQRRQGTQTNNGLGSASSEARGEAI